MNWCIISDSDGLNYRCEWKSRSRWRKVSCCGFTQFETKSDLQHAIYCDHKTMRLVMAILWKLCPYISDTKTNKEQKIVGHNKRIRLGLSGQGEECHQRGGWECTSTTSLLFSITARPQTLHHPQSPAGDLPSPCLKNVVCGKDKITRIC